MLNKIWLALVTLAVIVGVIEGRIAQVAQAVTDSAKLGFEIAFALTGVMVLWLGIMEIAMQSGLIKLFARLLKPLMSKLFTDIPSEDPAMGAMLLNIAANMLGLGNAATPFGIQAMKELQRLNNNLDIASDSMCIFLAINTSSVQLIPATAITFLAANGATDPTSIIFSALVATTISTIIAIIVVKQLAKLPFYKVKYASDL